MIYANTIILKHLIQPQFYAPTPDYDKGQVTRLNSQR